jgi:very-short-patch-repair endonuclease
VSIRDFERLRVSASLRRRWVERGLVRRNGPRAYVVCGAPPSWHQTLAVGLANLDGHGVVAGRAAARLFHLDGFDDGHVEYLVPRSAKAMTAEGVVRSTGAALTFRDITVVDGLRCVRAERLILDGPLFHFSQAQIENAIDSAIRLRLVSEQRVRTRVVQEHRSGVNGSRMLLDALVDSGGESRLERWLLRIVREGGLARPTLQKVFRDDGRTVARVDAMFGERLIVEVEGHGTHSSRRQRQADEERRTRLTLLGHVVLAFTYLDVRDRPQWVLGRIAEAAQLAA